MTPTSLPRERLAALARVIAATLLVTIAIAPGLFGADGWIAPLPILPIPDLALAALTIPLAAVALAVALGVRLHITLPLLLALLVLRCAPDRVLWQTYLLEWTACAAVASWASRDDTRVVVALESLRWMFGLLFIWAGLTKINPTFLEEGLSTWLSPLGLNAPPEWVHAAVAASESLLGIALLVPRTRYVASRALLVFSAGVAIALTFYGRNRVVVPWNVAHAVMVPILFARTDATPEKATLFRAPLLAIVLVFGALPALYPLGWPPYLSLRLYTASSLDATLYLDDVRALPIDARRVAARDRSETFRGSVSIETWAHAATSAFVPPEAAVFHAVTARVCRRIPHPTRLVLVLVPPVEWWRRAPETRYVRCRDLR